MFLNWTRVAILYEDEYGLIRLQELVRAPPTRNVEIYIRQVDALSSKFIKRFPTCFPPDPAQQLPQGAEGDQEQGDLQHYRGHQQGTHPPLLQNTAAAADEQ